MEVFVDEHGRPLISEKLPGDQNEMEKGAIKQLAQKVAAKYGNASAEPEEPYAAERAPLFDRRR